ncbi:MAG: geranylgeranyl reductase family protein [Candidatus Altiarchaeales archaeon]|nr:geranylgeranyl reductase family protein [Candidatus Altiarchaeales archaeon]
MNLKADVVVVGSGPAGGYAAKVLAESGVNVLVLDKRQELGTPKRCAEGVSKIGFKELGIQFHPAWAANEITGSQLYSPNGRMVDLSDQGDLTAGYIIERKIFEKFLAKSAIDAGARYMVKTLVDNLLIEDDRIVGVEAEYMGQRIKIESKIVIAADGVDSMTAKMAGIDTVNKISDYHSGFQYEMCGVKIRQDVISLYLGRNIAPKGYAWIFPKGGGRANVGIGITSQRGDNKTTKKYLDEFISQHPEIFEDAHPIEVNAGGIPVSSGVEAYVKDGFMVVGDAAQHVNPLHGGGIETAMLGGKIAAEIASKALDEGDTTKERLREYEEICRKKFGDKLGKIYKIRLLFEKLEDEEFNVLAEHINGADVLKIANGELKPMLKLLSKPGEIGGVVKKLMQKK